MNRTDRLLAIVLELQAARRCRAEDLAGLFETSVRTIYRDIQALSEAGVPVVAVPGQGYSLMEGYFLPPLTFSADEAAMLLLGSEVMATSFDAQYRAAAASAGRKIGAVLPDRLRDDVELLRQSILFIAGRRSAADEKLASLRRAILDRATVRFTYHARRTSDNSPPLITRDVDPYALAHMEGAWYLTGYDHVRKSTRTFRLSRMDDLEVLDRTFTRPTNVSRAVGTREPRSIEVRALFKPEAVRWVRENPSFYMVAEDEVPEGLLVTLHVRREDDALSWLLGWGRQVQVLEPESLRRRIADEARALLDSHAD